MRLAWSAQSRVPSVQAHGRKLVALILAAVVCPVDAEAPPAGESPPAHVLLITVDTLRADHLGCYGHHVDTSPTIDRLAREGVRFADATVQWPKTWPSMASMMTGLYPTASGVRIRPRRPLPDDRVTWAEILQDNGYSTGAIVSNANLGKKFSFDQGFDHFIESWMPEYRRQHAGRKFVNHPGCVKQYTDAATVVDQGLSWLDTVDSDEHIFLWLHFMEPHGPYEPPAAYAAMFDTAYPQELVHPLLIPKYQRQADPATGAPSNNLAFYKTQYDREIRYFDDQLARLLDDMKRRELLDDTLIVFTADHGESLGEQHYYLEHGRWPFQSTAHVPLIIWRPGVVPGGVEIPAPVGLIDILPTLLELLELQSPNATAGQSLLALMHGQADAAPSLVFMEAGAFEPTQIVVRHKHWKLIHLRSKQEQKKFGGAFVLYDLSLDPNETRNVGQANPEVFERLKTAAIAYVDGGPVKTAEMDEPEVELDEHTKRLLKSLGYAD